MNDGLGLSLQADGVIDGDFEGDTGAEVLGRDLSPDRVNVYEVMSKPVLTLPADMNVVYAVRLLVKFELTRAMVIDNDRNPVGIVTLRDMVLRALEDEDKAE